MRKLLVQRNQFEYVGAFSKPAFFLWGQGGKILEGLFTMFTPYQVGLQDIRDESVPQRPADSAIAIYVGSSSSFKFKLDQVEFTMYNFSQPDFQEFPILISRADEWLRTMIDNFSFGSHAILSISHSKLSEGTSKEFLLGLSSFDIPGIGVSEGTGAILHWEIPEEGWRVQLLVDHSTVVDDGLFISFLLRSSDDRIDYARTTTAGYELFKKALSQIGLEIE